MDWPNNDFKNSLKTIKTLKLLIHSMQKKFAVIGILSDVVPNSRIRIYAL